MSGDGTRIAVTGRQQKLNDGVIYFVDILNSATLEIVASVEINYPPSSLDLSPTGRYVTSNAYSDLTTIDMNSGHTVLSLGDGPAEIGAYAWNPVYEQLAFSIGSGLNIRNSIENATFSTLINPDGSISGVAWSSSGQDIATITFSRDALTNPKVTGSLQVWRNVSSLSNAHVSIPDAQYSGGRTKPKWSPSDQYIATIDTDKVIIFDVLDNQKLILTTPMNQSISSRTVTSARASMSSRGRGSSRPHLTSWRSCPNIYGGTLFVI